VRQIVAQRELPAYPFRVTAWRAGTGNLAEKTKYNNDLDYNFGRRSQCVSIKYFERMAATEIDLAVGTVGDAYDSALADCVI
jgi:hypothetical protein